MQSSTAWALQSELHRSSGAKNAAIRMTTRNGITAIPKSIVWILLRLRRGRKPRPFKSKCTEAFLYSVGR